MFNMDIANNFLAVMGGTSKASIDSDKGRAYKGMLKYFNKGVPK